MLLKGDRSHTESDLVQHLLGLVLPGPDVPGGEVDHPGQELVQLGAEGRGADVQPAASAAEANSALNEAHSANHAALHSHTEWTDPTDRTRPTKKQVCSENQIFHRDGFWLRWDRAACFRTPRQKRFYGLSGRTGLQRLYVQQR